MGPPSTERVFLRNSLTDTPKKAAPKSVAFSPDIIPSFGNNVPESTLISTYSSFVSLPVIPFDVNNVYVRGRVLDRSGSAVFNMVAVPSELILWPQVWNKSQPLAPGPIVVPTAAEIEFVGAGAPFTVRPSDLGGVNYALVAVQSLAPDKLEDNVRLKDALTPFPSDISNWRDYHDWISTDKSTTFYNTIVADSTSPIISITTRLRLFEDEPSITSIDVMLLFEHVGLDPNTEVSIVSDVGNVFLGRTKLGADTGTVGVHPTLPSNFDGLVTFNIFPTAQPIAEMSWLALRISTLKQEAGVATQILLGAQNVVFASDATRNARFLSPAAFRANDTTPATAFKGFIGKPTTNVAREDTMTVQTSMTIPPGFDPTTVWLLLVDGHFTPIGSFWQLTSTGDPIPGVNISFPKTEIAFNNPTQFVQFTGIPSTGYQMTLILKWWSNGLPPVGGGDISFNFALIEDIPNTPAPSRSSP